MRFPPRASILALRFFPFKSFFKQDDMNSSIKLVFYICPTVNLFMTSRNRNFAVFRGSTLVRDGRKDTSESTKKFKYPYTYFFIRNKQFGPVEGHY